MAGIKQVVLYKHGVGYFERVEEVEGEGTIHLSFRAQDMNDVLKSLTAIDLDGGSIGSISYDATEPVSALLEKVSIRVPSQGGTAALCAALRGARVRVEWGSRTLEGQIAGVEQTSLRTADGIAETAFLSLLSDDGSLHSLSLREVKQVTFLDEHIRKDLDYYYRTLIHSYKQDTKNLVVHSRGDGARRLRLSYTLECPVWKTSYRIILGEGDEAPFVQGWALVDNVQDEDWVDVEMTLAAGLPISFRHDLYSPRRVIRREVEVKREAAAGPVVAEAAVRARATMMADPFGAPSMPPGADPFAAAAPSADPFAASPFDSTVDAFGAQGGAGMLRQQAREAAAQVVGQSVGDLFFYHLNHPVTVLRNQSALVPILASEMQGRRVVLYTREERAENPFAAVELTNTTELTLEGGPAVIFEGQSYSGEAMVDTLKPEDHRIISYAVDLGVVVESEHNSTREAVNLIRVQRGLIQRRSALVESRTYSFWNKDKRDKLCLLQHPVRTQYTLTNTPDPKETTARHYRFEVPLPAGQQAEFCVRERCDHWQSEQVVDLTGDGLGVYVEKGYFNAQQRQELAEVIKLNQELADLVAERGEVNRKAQDMTRDQERLRENLKALGDGEARLRTLYAEKLEEGENTFGALQQQAHDLDSAISAQKARLNAAILAVSFEVLLG